MIHNVKFKVTLPSGSEIFRSGDYGVADIWPSASTHDSQGFKGRVTAIVAFDTNEQSRSPQSGFNIETPVQLETGQYIVRLKFPNGQLHSEVIEIEGSKRNISVFLNEPAAHVHWDTSRKYYESSQVNVSNVRSLKPKGIVNNALLVSLLSSLLEDRKSLYRNEGVPNGFSTNNFVSDEVRKMPSLEGIFGDIVDCQPITKDGIEGPGLWTTLANDTSSVSTLPDKHVVRKFVQLSRQDSSDKKVLACLPLPWLPGYHKPQWEIHIYIKTGLENRSDYGLSIGVSDSRIQSILGFMTNGDLDASLKIVDMSLDYLCAKFENPYAAAAAGYVLVMAPRKERSKFESWAYWIGNLGKYFEQIPDGKILHATLLLQRGDTSGLDGQEDEYFPKDVSARILKAQDLVLTAVSMGPPIYRLGLRLLASNLRILCNSIEPTLNKTALEQASEIVNFLSIRVDPNEPFSIFSFP